jgi:hypothetical protein
MSLCPYVFMSLCLYVCVFTTSVDATALGTLCVMCYVLCVMCYVLCVMFYVLCVMCYVLCIMHFSIKTPTLLYVQLCIKPPLLSTLYCLLPLAISTLCQNLLNPPLYAMPYAIQLCIKPTSFCCLLGDQPGQGEGLLRA